MLNLTDLMSLMTVFISAVGGCTYALSEKAAWWAVVLFTADGWLIGYGVAVVYSKLSYAVLKRETGGIVVAVFILDGFILPVLSLCIGPTLTIALAAWLLGHV
jgi:hypothetical protein